MSGSGFNPHLQLVSYRTDGKVVVKLGDYTYAIPGDLFTAIDSDMSLGNDGVGVDVFLQESIGDESPLTIWQ